MKKHKRSPSELHPPKWPDKLLKWLCPDEMLEEVQGDLHERYYLLVQRMGEKKAHRLYFSEVMAYMPSFFIKRDFNQAKPLHTDMLTNYLTIAFRNILRHKAFSFINILGLAIGMTCSILILFWVKDELSYDRFHKNTHKLYRLTIDISGMSIAPNVAPIAPALKAQMPEIKNTARVAPSESLFEVGIRKFEEKKVLYVDASFLDMFTFPILSGSAKNPLSNPDEILITEAIAKKYFGNENPLGKTIRMDNAHNFTVTGILANIPSNSHLQFDFLLPTAFLEKRNNDFTDNADAWGNFGYYTYVQLHDHFFASPAALSKLESSINQLYKLHNSKFTNKDGFHLQPLHSIHLYSNLLADVAGHGNLAYVHTFSVVAIFILLVASINFMNLSTARSARRAKEVGLRKVVGARRGQLISQFLAEASCISFIALLIALLVIWLLLPLFNDLTGKAFSIRFLDAKLILSLIGLALVTGLLSGSYPALFLSGFQPVKVIKGTMKLGNINLLFRNGLVVTQFVVSIALLVGTAVVYHQLQFIKNKNLGFDKENLLYTPMTGNLWQNYQTLRNELKQNSFTNEYTVVSTLPTNLTSGTASVEWEGKNPEEHPLFFTMAVDENFIQVFKMQQLAGRNFSEAFKSDTANYIVNEKALGFIGLDVATAIGKPLSLFGKQGTIIGVVKDFNFKPLQQAIEPLILNLNTQGGTVVVRTKPGNTEATISALENIAQKLNPAYPFAYNFVDEDLANLYQGEERMGILFNAFACLAILISCLGLYGLSAFIAEQRIKEIGVRKVLGASTFGVVYLLSKNFTKLVLIAMAIAIPLSWLAMKKWLEGFVYHIDINPGILLWACFTALLVAWLTISYESIKAALANPIKSLRNE